jgi:neutral ceramidase
MNKLKRILESIRYFITGFIVLFPAELKAQECDRVEYQVGLSKSQITGPVLPIGMMGYADISQKVVGIHMPQMSRAMVIEDGCQKNLVGLVVAEIGMVFHHLKYLALKRLSDKAPGVFNESNLMVSATHTHAGIGGYAERLMYNITVGGYYASVEDSIVDGIVESLLKAYENRVPGSLEISSIKSTQPIQFNRSLDAYEKNPEWEKAMYGNSVDPEMVVLSAKDQNGKRIGNFNWFGVHPVSLSMENKLISGDNKGLAAYLLEQHMSNLENDSQSGIKDHSYVSGFVQSKAGDVSPYPVDWGPLPSDHGWSRNQDHGRLQFELARQAIEKDGEKVRGPVVGETQFVVLSKNTFKKPDSEVGETFGLCGGVLGVAFAAGTENGKPVPIFKEGTIYGINWPMLTLMPKEQECQGAKVMLLPTGFLGSQSWTANEAPFQLIRIGQFLIAGLPFEITTMAGRRLERRLQGDLEKFGVKKVVLTSLANEYLHYVTTKEEYESQQYEGGSNLFGARSLEAYESIYHDLAHKVALNEKSILSPKGLFEGILPQASRIPLLTPQNFWESDKPDKPLKGYQFGDLMKAPQNPINSGEWQVVEWVGARWEHQDFKRINEVGAVEHFDGKEWVPYLGIESPDTTVAIETRGSRGSLVRMSWYPRKSGEYRMCYQGRAMLGKNRYHQFRSCSLGFKVVNDI